MRQVVYVMMLFFLLTEYSCGAHLLFDKLIPPVLFLFEIYFLVE
jgi:hypothetical protein